MIVGGFFLRLVRVKAVTYHVLPYTQCVWIGLHTIRWYTFPFVLLNAFRRESGILSLGQ